MRNRRRNEYETRIISDAKFRIVRFASIGCRTPLTVSSALTKASIFESSTRYVHLS